MIRRLAALLLFLAAAALTAAEPPQTSLGSGGGVAAEEATAAGVGIEILRQGGNAADAAVAVAFALAVTWPEAGNIGGGGFWISRDAHGRVLAIDFRETAPGSARRELFFGAPGRPAPSSTEGPLASGVPGSVAGLALAHRRAGRLPWKRVVAPAIALARDGFTVTPNVSESIAAERTRLAKDTETARIFLPDGNPPASGTVLRQPALARTLEAIRDRGEDGFYRGEVGRAIAEGQKKIGGLITRGDLGRYEPRLRPPLKFRFLGAEVMTLPAPSSGPVLAEMALSVERVADRARPPGAESMHWLSEIEKRAFRDRNQLLGDPAFHGGSKRTFTDPVRIARLVASIDPAHSTRTASLTEVFPEKPTTTHFSVVDADGMVVAVTTTLNDSFGNARVAPGLGFLMNNEMDDFATRPGEKNLYGLIQGEVNAVAPGKRMTSSMCPTIAVLPGRGVFAWGSPGGSTIITTNLQVLLSLVLRSQPLVDALAAPRFHQQDYPDAVEVERDSFDPAWIAALERMGHAIKASDRDPVSGRLGRVHAVAALPDGRSEAAADPRRHGAGLVVHPAP
ncbi:MAG: gamma-glutamyltransferase [Syntrophomonadaceae bacterium]